MNITDVDKCASQFSTHKEEVFNALLEHYKRDCQKWYRYVSRRAKIERDEFYGRFALLLFNTLVCFNPDFKQIYEVSQSKFDRYFMSAVRRLPVIYIRQAIRRRRKPRSVNIDSTPITVPTDFCEEVYMNDLISNIKDPIDQELVRLRVLGNSREDVCVILGLRLHQYRARLERIKRCPVVASLMTSS